MDPPEQTHFDGSLMGTLVKKPYMNICFFNRKLEAIASIWTDL